MRNVTKATIAVAALALTMGFAQAEESMNAQPNGSNAKENSPGSTGAMANANKNGIATDPQGVAEQSKSKATSNASPGTVGAAPGADVSSSKPNH